MTNMISYQGLVRTFPNGSIMDIGFYCLASAVALFGEPKSVQATASLLASGVDAQGVVVMDYGDFSVTLQHSKVSDSVLASEIQGEAGSLVIEKLSECQKVCLPVVNYLKDKLSNPVRLVKDYLDGVDVAEGAIARLSVNGVAFRALYASMAWVNPKANIPRSAVE